MLLGLAGCATDPNKFYMFRDTDAPPPDAGPALTSVSLRLYTGAHEKLASTGLFIFVTDSSGETTVARASNVAHSASDVYAMSSVHEMNLPVEQVPHNGVATVFYKEGLRAPRFSIGIMANGSEVGSQGRYYGFDRRQVFSGHGGENLWSFDAHLTLTFADGSTIETTREGLKLESRGGELIFTQLQ